MKNTIFFLYELIDQRGGQQKAIEKIDIEKGKERGRGELIKGRGGRDGGKGAG